MSALNEHQRRAVLFGFLDLHHRMAEMEALLGRADDPSPFSQTAPDLAPGDGMVGVVAHLRGKVEGHRQAGLPLLEQVSITLVGLRGRAEARVLSHRPQPSAVPRRLNAARERKLPREAQKVVRVLTYPDLRFSELRNVSADILRRGLG